MTDRRQDAYATRLEAAELARNRAHPDHEANGDEQRYAGDQYFMSFTKGLPHHPDTGLLFDATHFVEFRRAIDEGFIDPFTDRVPHGAKVVANPATGGLDPANTPASQIRQWEAPTAGTAHDLQGPDAQAVTMPPAPALLGDDGQVNPELIFEMAEVYELAILRDQSLNAFENGQSTPEIDAAIQRLNALSYAQNMTGRPRKRELVAGNAELTAQTVFRGSSPGVEVGPYLSQFMLMGSPEINGAGSVAKGRIAYGVLQIDQRVPVAKPGANHMQDLTDYIDVQRGIKPPSAEEVVYVDDMGNDAVGATVPARRFLSTPRDLATYVHFDALYEAYLNACLVLLGMGTPADPACDHLSGTGLAAANPETRRNAGGFALYGGPHILTLVTEVATRALKAVRFQKFNNHIRLRPEALAHRIELVRRNAVAPLDLPSALLQDVEGYRQALEGNGGGGNSTLFEIAQMNTNAGGDPNSYFLPMAFAEGSPMHPAYGAGHATVAGACVTILKAYFDTSTVLARTQTGEIKFKRVEATDQPVAYRAPAIPAGPAVVDANLDLVEDNGGPFLTLEGELNKLAANISIGRNMAGVHYFSDYYDSLRMGEAIALGVLEEQALTYPTDPFVLSVPTFDGGIRRIGRR